MVLGEMRSQAQMYAQQFDGEPYLSQKEINDTLDGKEASKKQVNEAADELMGFYDQLLGEDTSDLREGFKDDILYDMSVGEILRPRADKQTAAIFGSGLVAPAAFALIEPSMAGEALGLSGLVCEAYNARSTASNAEAGYNPFSKKIGVSRGTLPERQAYDTLASELFHRYQHEFDSDTWMDIRRSEDVPPITEGLERAVKIEALDYFAENEFRGLDWETLRDQRAASTAINGYAQALSEISDVEESDLVELGLTSEKASEALDNVGSAESKGYDVVASAILNQGSINSGVYRDIYKGRFEVLPSSVH